MKNESHKGNERVFPDRGREDLFLRAFGKRNIRWGYAEDCECK